MNDVIFRVETAHSDGPCNMEEGNFDIIIMSVPKGWYLGDALLVPIVDAQLRKITQTTADLCKRHIHHAEFVITDDRAVVEERVNMHDCVKCRSGGDQATALLGENPGSEVCVGSIWYVPREAPERTKE